MAEQFADGSGFGGGFGRAFESGNGMGGRRMRGRVLNSDALRLVLLSRIAAEPAHGYELIKAIEEMTGGSYAPSPGMVYPLLTMLADQGLAEEQADGSRKRYAITEAGTAALAAEAEAVAEALARLEHIGNRAARAGASPVRRALKNVEAALAARLAGGDNRELELQAAAILDEAAQRIERL
jgi:DNA-binding PadR family transcriptional regulator